MFSFISVVPRSIRVRTPAVARMSCPSFFYTTSTIQYIIPMCVLCSYHSTCTNLMYCTCAVQQPARADAAARRAVRGRAAVLDVGDERDARSCRRRSVRVAPHERLGPLAFDGPLAVRRAGHRPARHTQRHGIQSLLLHDDHLLFTCVHFYVLYCRCSLCQRLL